MADGSIRINTKLDTKEAQADLVKFEKECEKTAQKIGEAGEKIKASFTGMSIGQLNNAFRRVNKDLEKTNAQIAELDRQIGAVQAETDKMLPMATTDEQVSNLLAIEELQTRELVQKRDALTAKAAEYKSQLQTITGEVERQKNKQKEQQAEVDKTTQKTKKLGKAGADAGNKTDRSMRKASSSTNKLGQSITKGIKRMGKMALACLGIRAAFGAVRKAASAYMEDNQKLSQQMSSLWNIAGQAIGPFIEAMVKGISTVVAWVNTLIKTLTGVDLVARANAAALKKQASATKEAAKAAQLAGFDEMNKLTDTSGSSSSGDGAALFDASMAGDMPNFIEKMKEQILAGDWYGAGATLGTALMDGMRSVDWASAGRTIGKTVTDAASFALGFIFALDPATILGSVNSFLGGLFEGISKGLQKLDWEEIGGKILEYLAIGLIGAIGLANPIAGIFVVMLTPNSDELARGAAELVGSIIGALAKALVGAGKKAAEIGKNLWTSIKNYFDKYVNWEGTPEEIINGLLEGIKDAFKGAGKWIHDNIWVPFRDGFKKAFGIASPSKKMKELGGYLIDGLWSGIGNIWNKTKAKFTEFKNSISSWFSNTKKSFNTGGSGVISSFGSGIGNIWSKIKSKFTDVKTSIGSWASSLKTSAKTAGANFVSGLTSGLNTLKTKLKDPINALIGMVEKALNWIIGKMNKLSWSVPDWVPVIGGKTFGFNMSTISIPRLARGGVVNNPGRGVPVIAGEAGAEAVLPLENNTEWMDTLAAKINAGVQKIVVPIYLNGRKIAEEVIDLTNKRNFATNGAI